MGKATQHAKASASGSHRWLNCTAAPTFESQFPDNDPGKYAKEGTLAHKICELTVNYNAGYITKRKFNSQIKKCRTDELFSEEMIKTAEVYGEYIWEKVMSFSEKPYQQQEVRVDFSDYVPEGFGTSDCIILGSGHLIVVDYKHGKGVPVSAENNSQMRLYALGALKKYGMFYPIDKVTMAIVQPRVTEEVSEETIPLSELLSWGERIKPIAQKAVSGIGAEFKEGTWCQFCKGKAVCRARSENMTALEDFKDLPIDGKLSDDEKTSRMAAMDAGFTLPPVLTDTEIGDLLYRAETLVSWYNDLKAYALEAILTGKDIPGWKAVAGRSVRAFDDADQAIEDIKKAGYEEAMLYERKPKTLAQLEKVIGKKEFDRIAGSHVIKPIGKPTLAEISDKREPYNQAAVDFKGATQA
ncbi:MAG: DUF2800 domain-containing protein [Eubacterium sp.]|nr:DUF2800 domain-containing protein [Eubacterium sp.]